MSNVTGGDLYSLWKIANVALPRAAAVYTGSSGIPGIASTTAPTDAAFKDSDESQYGPSFGIIHPEFVNMRDELWHVMADTARNLVDTGAALNRAIAVYRSQDGAAGASLDSIIKGMPDATGTKLHDPSDPSQNPLTGNDAPDPGAITQPDGYRSPGDKRQGG